MISWASWGGRASSVSVVRTLKSRLSSDCDAVNVSHGWRWQRSTSIRTVAGSNNKTTAAKQTDKQTNVHVSVASHFPNAEVEMSPVSHKKELECVSVSIDQLYIYS